MYIYAATRTLIKIMTAKNPLFEPQREKAGAQTYDKYRYQYHWALYRVLMDHDISREYAVFVEFHEDVVICDSLDAKDASFEFNQVKTTSKNFTTNELTKLKKSVKGTSVLSKLINGALGKSYASKLTNLNLVSVYPFKFDFKVDGISLEKITLEDLSTSQIEKLENAIKDELGEDVGLPKNLQFVVSNLSEKNYQNDVIASITNLIEKLYPESYCKPNDIYRLLIDEINKKGIITHDYTKWDDLLDKKALTSRTVSRVISQFTNIKNEAQFQLQFDSIASELGLTVIPKRNLKKEFDKYRLTRLSNRSVLQLEITASIVKLINNQLNNGEESIIDLIEHVSTNLDDKFRNTFSSPISLKGAIICEYILENE